MPIKLRTFVKLTTQDTNDLTRDMTIETLMPIFGEGGKINDQPIRGLIETKLPLAPTNLGYKYQPLVNLIKSTIEPP